MQYTNLHEHMAISYTFPLFVKDPFTITDGTEGFAVSYTITYSDAVHHKICDTATILASSCISGSCSHTFELSTSSCHPYADITITVFGTSQLGNGSVSEPVTVGRQSAIS